MGGCLLAQEMFKQVCLGEAEATSGLLTHKPH